MLCDLAAKVAEEVHKVAEAEIVVHGSDLVVFALFKDACTHVRARPQSPC